MTEDFGTEDVKYFHLPNTLSSDSVTNEFLKALNNTLATVRQLTQKHQEELIAERQKSNPEPELLNQYQLGDLMLYDTLYDPSKSRVPKLNSRQGYFLWNYKIIPESFWVKIKVLDF